MRNRKLRNIRHSEAFSPEVTSSQRDSLGARMRNWKLRNMQSEVPNNKFI
jgi:hypothetical protein